MELLLVGQVMLWQRLSSNGGCYGYIPVALQLMSLMEVYEIGPIAVFKFQTVIN